MAAPTRDELLELARLFSTHVAWQRELGTTEVPSEGEIPWTPLVLPEAPSVPVAAAPVPTVAAPAPKPAAPLGPPAMGAPAVPAMVVPRPAFATPVAAKDPPRAPEAPKVTAAPTLSLSLTTPPTVAAPAILTGAAVEGEERVHRLAVIADEVKSCRGCRLANTRKNTVFARGNPFARLFFIGEGPGEQEDLQGLPFVGPAGQLLDRIITRGMGLDPEKDVYVGNIVKCRPPNNRVPEPDEMTACTPFLVRQLDLVRPDVIVALGRTAVSFLLDTKDSMTRLRGKWRSYHGIAVMPTWHPSYLLRTPEAKGDTWADVKLVLERLGRPVPGRQG